jgi:glycosyltransferase involved in cell wall biosynthesis
MQMMRELSRVVPVVYINSIGMRMPRVGEGRVFIRRIGRKLKSLRRGLVQVRDQFWVLSPVAAPGRVGAMANRHMLAGQVRRGARRAGIRRPLVWIACPPGVEALEQLNAAGVVYQRTDRFEAFHGVDADQIMAYDRRLKGRADLTLFCSSHLHDAEASACKRASFIDHGVDFDRFAAAGQGGASEPVDVGAIPRPRVGFIGGIDAHTFDPPLFRDVAHRMPDVHFVLVGGCSLEAGWCDLPNVHLLGRKQYDDVASYMAACDVLFMAWNASEWIQACNPVKLKEYLAVGRPIVSTPFPELARYDGLVRVASDATEFAAEVADALEQAHDADTGRRRVMGETWGAKAEAVLNALRDSGIVPAGVEVDSNVDR